MAERWSRSELEGFEAQRLERSLPLLRAFLALAALGTPLFAFWDRFVDPGVPPQALQLRLGFAAMAGLLLALSFAPRLRIWLFLLIPLAQWLGVMAISVLLSWLEQGFLYGLPGLLLTGMAMIGFAPLFRIYVLSCLACLILPNLVMFYAQVPAKLVVHVNVFLLAMFALQMVFGWFLWRLSRQEFALEQRLEHLATRDGLTQLYNRRQFLSLLDAEFARSQRYELPLCFAMLDLDHFKSINDRFGHAVGDWVLVHFAECGRKLLREQDVFGRLGGEEFGVLLVHADGQQALEAMERLRRAVEAAELPLEQETLRYTISIGLAERGALDGDVAALMHRADQALYQAKRQGRNQVVLAGA